MLYLEDFKGFARARLDLQRPLTVLIGPNGSGKSNVIEGLELFSFIARGQPLHQISDLGRGGALEIRGGLEECPRYGQTAFSMGLHGVTDFEGIQDRWFSYRITVEAEPRPRIIEETLLFDDNTMIFQTLEGSQSDVSGTIRVRYNNFAQGRNKPVVPVSDNVSVLSQYVKFAKSRSKMKSVQSLIGTIMTELEAPVVFDPAPRLMRNYERIGKRELLRNGSNISAVLYALKQGNGGEQPSLQRLLGWIRQLPEEPYVGVDFVTTRLNDVIFGLQEGPDQHLVDARLLSDGTLRTLAVLTALETAKKKSRVIIEEFDNGLHPSRVRILTEALTSCSQRNNLKVIVTTHNPATLDILEPSQLDGVVLCFWDKALGASNLVRLSDLPRSDELLERGGLGDLVTRRVIDRYLPPDFEEQRKRKALAWLESLS